jgi:DNA polymerase type B, organellar and viral
MPRKIAKKAKPSPLVIGIDDEYQFNAKTGLNDLLSCQAFVYNPGTGLTFSYIHKPKKNYRGRYPRPTLGEFLGLVLYAARKKRVIEDYPRSITLVGFFTRADLCMFDDFHTSLKRKLAAVRGTYVTTSRRLPLRLVLPDGERRVSLSVVDTRLLAPANSNLAMIGDQIGLPKFEIMEGYSIEEMERFRTEQPEAFDEYAIRDAEIAARYAISIFDLFRQLGISGGKPTLGSAGVALFKLLFPNKETWREFLGQDYKSESKTWRPHPDAILVSSFTPGSYHGGMNSIYGVGYSSLGREVLDVDLAGAYTTALAAIGWPDWSSSRYTESLDDLAVVDEAMTFARVKFCFPLEAQPPCLPIRSDHQHGLIYPHEGESWCCGPELVVARSMGCSIVVLNGYRVDWVPGRANPFAIFASNIAKGRKAAKKAGNAMLELVYKLLGNTLYGKISQGVSSKRPIADDVEAHHIFDAETGEMADLPPSSVTSPCIAAFATSLVRAMMLEALHRLPSTAIALQATTDGILFVGSESDIDTSGPVAMAFRRAATLVTGDPDPPIWEVKHRLPRALPFKTRGLISVVPDGWTGKIHLAKAGAHFPEHLKNEIESTRYAEQLYRERKYDTTYERKDLTSLSEQYKTGCDLTAVTRAIRLNWDYDFKNEPIDVCDVEGVISFRTRPWRTLKDFETRRKDFEDWQRSQHRVLRTARDYFDFVEWVALRSTRKLLRTRSDGILPNLARVIAAEAMRRPWRKRPSYAVIAEALARATGKSVTLHTINEIRRRRDLIPHQCVPMLSPDDIEFARVYGTNPIAFEQLRSAILPGSIAEQQFADIWEKRLPAPAPVLETQHINGFDYFRIFEDRCRLLTPNVGPGEAHLRAIEFTVNFCRSKLGIDFEAAKSTVLTALRAA